MLAVDTEQLRHVRPPVVSVLHEGAGGGAEGCAGPRVRVELADGLDHLLGRIDQTQMMAVIDVEALGRFGGAYDRQAGREVLEQLQPRTAAVAHGRDG